jgi:hypothetical protein
VIQTLPAGGSNPAGNAVSPLGGGVTVDHASTLFEAWIAYDFRPCWWWKGCGPDCDHCGEYKYAPTFTLIAGKLKPFFGLDEFLRNSNQQFVDFSMANWFFDSDDDVRLMGAGFQAKAFDDRFFMQTTVTNGNEGSFQPNTQMDNLPGFISSFWYDLGGRWDCENKRWELFGDCISDIDYSCCPVARVGGGVNLVPLNRRSLYGDNEQSRVFVMPAGPGGTRLINVLNGDLAAPAGSHAVDMFDSYSYNTFAAAKYHGFSIANEWWFRNLNNFRTTPNGMGNIIYTSSIGNALFPASHGLFDYGMTLQAGYFIVPKKLEVAARWSWIRGDSGDINGTGKFTSVTVPGVTGPVRVITGAFRQFHEANEYTVAISYYFKRHFLKWQTDFGIYDGGNPVGAGGQSVAGFISGQDGFMARTQIQLMF